MVNTCNILVTGANGFVGRALFENLQKINRYRVFGTVRTTALSNDFLFTVGDLAANTDWKKALFGQDVIIHVAGRAHVTNESTIDPLVEYRKVNVAGTLNLAKQAADAGVKRFIFISSIGVNGSHQQSKPFINTDIPHPWDNYSQSKYEAELGLWQIGHETGMEVIVIRPPLVYGDNAPGNFNKLIHAVKEGKWLPLGKIKNKKSFIALDNLVDLIATCIDHPKAANQTFLASDGWDVSTTELLQMMAHAFGKKAKLIPIPMSWIQIMASLLGKKAIADRLCGSLQVDITHTRETLGWRPPVTMAQQLAKIAASMSLPRDV